MKLADLTPADREVVSNFQNFLAQAGPPGSALYPRSDDPAPRPWPPALWAYAWGLTSHCPPPGTW